MLIPPIEQRVPSSVINERENACFRVRKSPGRRRSWLYGLSYD